MAAIMPVLLSAQAAWIEPDPTSIDFDPSAEATIYVDANQTECADLATFDEVYIWTWMPAELPEGDDNHNGMWGESNEALQMTAEGEGIFSFTLIPTEFYKVDAAIVYDNDFSFLIKLRDGAGGLTTCGEDKSEDLEVTAEPVVLERKVNTFPGNIADTLPTTPSDFFTLIYNKNLEEGDIAAATEFTVFLKMIDEDGKIYNYARPNELDDFVELRMTNVGNDVFHWTVQPEQFAPRGNEPIPEGKALQGFRVQIAKVGAATAADLVVGVFDYYFKCP